LEKIKHSFSYVIFRDATRKEILVVLRQANDAELPNIWGLPAGTLEQAESYADGIIRTGRDKLGVELKVIREIDEGFAQRSDYILHMKMFEVEIVAGEPRVPQDDVKATQYAASKWATPDILREGASKGSLCCKLFLDYLVRCTQNF